jgi:hypothetical protein
MSFAGQSQSPGTPDCPSCKRAKALCVVPRAHRNYAPDQNALNWFRLWKFTRAETLGEWSLEKGVRRVPLYLFLLIVEAAGAVSILWHGVPIYRRFLAGAVEQKADLATLAWALLGVILIQGAYWWATVRVFPSLSVRPNMLLGHAVLFLARLSFVFAGGLFATIIFVRFAEIEFSWWRALMLLGVLFSIFCFTLELERLGQMLMGRSAASGRIAR